MEHDANGTDSRIKVRDSAMRLLNRLTAGVAFAAIGGVGVFGVVSAHTVAGTSSSTSSVGSTTTSSSTSSSSSSSIQSSTTSVSSSASSGVAVSGGS